MKRMPLKRSVRFTDEEIHLLVSVAASVDPERYVESDVKAVIMKAKAVLDAAEAYQQGRG